MKRGRPAAKPTQKAGEEEEEVGEEEDACAVCMDTLSLKAHQCKVCKPSAWVICSGCELNILSRECPMCRGPYAPRIFYPWAFKVDFSSKEALQRPENNLAQIQLVSDSFGVWDPSTSVLTFSLPQDATLPPNQIRYLKCSLPVPEGLKTEGTFTFVSSTWDELEKWMEDSGGDHLCDLKEMLKWFCKAIAEPGAVLLTPMEPAEAASFDLRLNSHLEPTETKQTDFTPSTPDESSLAKEGTVNSLETETEPSVSVKRHKVGESPH